MELQDIQVLMEDFDFQTVRGTTTTRIDAFGGLDTYLVPYLPVTPTFLVLFVIFAVVAGMNGLGDGGDGLFDVRFSWMSKFFCGSLSLCPRKLES